MIIVRAPYRISLGGGSCDYPSYYKKYGALCIGFTVNLYVYVCISPALNIFPYKTRITYSRIEDINSNSDIQNNGVRGVLEYFGLEDGLNISIQTDLPAQSGIGSSSALIVALIRAIDVYKHGRATYSNRQIADMAIEIERTRLAETGGEIDQIQIAFGGQNAVTMNASGYKVRPWPVCKEFLDELRKRSLLCYVGSRQSYKLAEAHSNADLSVKHEISRQSFIAYDTIGQENVDNLAYIIGDAWEQKRKIPGVSNENVDSIIEKSKKLGAISGRLLGNGGSGVMFFILRNGVDKEEIADSLGLENIEWDYSYGGAEVLLK